jgi:hypothetical protein
MSQGHAIHHNTLWWTCARPYFRSLRRLVLSLEVGFIKATLREEARRYLYSYPCECNRCTVCLGELTFLLDGHVMIVKGFSEECSSYHITRAPSPAASLARWRGSLQCYHWSPPALRQYRDTRTALHDRAT